MSSSIPAFVGDPQLWGQTTYDSLGRVTRIDTPDSNHVESCYSLNVVTQVDANGHRKRQTSDVNGNLVRIDEYEGTVAQCTTDLGTPYATTHYDYDDLGQLIQVTDAHGNQTTITYDSLGQKRSMNDPDMGAWSYEYDPMGNLTWQKDANLQETSFAYDSLGRLATKTYPDASTVTYVYDDPAHGCPGDSATQGCAAGRMTRMVDATGSTDFYFNDPLGADTRMVKTIDSQSYEIKTVLDPLGRISHIIYPAFSPSHPAETVGYLYDEAGNLTQVGNYATFSGFNALGQIGQVTYANGVTTDYVYEPFTQRLWMIDTAMGANPLLDLSYGYDNKGNVLDITNGLNANKTQNFTYDALDRLLSASSQVYGNLSYNYDKIGNFQTKEGVIHTPFPGKPHAVGFTSDGGVYDYDGNGNMTSDGLRTLAWNADNLPTGITLDDAQGTPQTTSFEYDGSGARVKKAGPMGTTFYFGQLIEVSGGVPVKYIFANGKRIAVKTTETAPLNVRYYHQDHLGSTGVVTLSDGSVFDEIFYKAFGDEPGQAPTGSTHRFTGQELDFETGLYDYNARYYNPTLGKFISADTIVPDPGMPQAFNRYAYCVNNPVIYSDPSGHFFVEMFIGAAIGGMIGGTSAEIQGGDFWQGALTGAITGAIMGGIGGYTSMHSMALKDGWMSAAQAQSAGLITGGQAATLHAAGGAIAGGIGSGIGGGNIGQGMLVGGISGGVGRHAGNFLPGNISSPGGFAGNLVGRSFIGGTFGGITAELSGGAFWDGFSIGATTAGIGFLANCFWSEVSGRFIHAQERRSSPALESPLKVKSMYTQTQIEGFAKMFGTTYEVPDPFTTPGPTRDLVVAVKWLDGTPIVSHIAYAAVAEGLNFVPYVGPALKYGVTVYSWTRSTEAH